MKKVNLFENLKNVIEKIKNMSEQDFQAWKFILIFLVVADLFGVYWFLEMKTLGSALLLVLIAMFAILLYFSGQETNNNRDENKKKSKQEDGLDIFDGKEPKKKEEGSPLNFDLGISAQNMQKNIDDALKPF